MSYVEHGKTLGYDNLLFAIPSGEENHVGEINPPRVLENISLDDDDTGPGNIAIGQDPPATERP